MSSSWVYLFSKFTSEALLFEAFAICVLIASYGAVWILRRRHLAMNGEVPASVVRLYLNELIGDATSMRARLFGLGIGEIPTAPAHGAEPTLAAAPAASPSAPNPATSDPDLVKKVSMLETKLAEQTAAVDKISGEKLKLESELALAKSGDAGAAAGTPSEETQKLKEKLEMLEARLAEYSVIEDDLANLKRLQQENQKLKAQLAGGAHAPAASAPAGPAATPTPAAAVAAEPEAPAPAEAAPEVAAAADVEAALAQVAAAPAPAAVEAASPDPVAAAALAEVAAAEPAADPAPAAAPAAADPNFESLVDEVEKSLNETPAAAAPAPAAAAPTKEKTDADLIAEFEKMLNS